MTNTKKLPKIAVFYNQTPPPSFIWVYKCSKCRWFINPNDCQVVCRKGEPDLDIINPNSWCILWVNKEDDLPFSWINKS